MIKQINHYEELVTAWRALGGSGGNQGWRIIPIAQTGPCRFLAGRHFPGNEETLLVGFGSLQIPSTITLPKGRGFDVGRVSLEGKEASHAWVSLSKKDSGSLDLFILMVTDVIATIKRYPKIGEERSFSLFLSRIRAWQDFMHENREGVLSPEAEIGLCGELHLLSNLIDAGLPVSIAIDGWQGPLGGIQDFRFGTGAIEVKSTVGEGCFVAKIGCLEQLDETLISPLFLMGSRFELSPYGKSLPEWAADLHNLMADDNVKLPMFEEKLLRAGLLPGAEDRYIRKFSHLTTKIFRVFGSFPRIISENTANEIRKARYEIDLDLIPSDSIDITNVIAELGVI